MAEQPGGRLGFVLNPEHVRDVILSAVAGMGKDVTHKRSKDRDEFFVSTSTAHIGLLVENQRVPLIKGAKGERVISPPGVLITFPNATATAQA